MTNAILASERIGSKLQLPMLLAHLAAGHARIGEHQRGLDLLNEAVRVIEDTNEKLFEAELYRMRGSLLISVGEKRNAEAALERALIVAHEQEAKRWELRAATTLARLWQDQGRHAEARDLLAPVYGWFTEGFDTGDLMDAKALLSRLNA